MSIDDDFIDRILEGEASEEEAAEFQRWLQVPENLERFALRAELHSDLRRSVRRRHIQKIALEATKVRLVTGSALSREKLSERVSPSRKMSVLTTAGLLMAACILIAFLLPEGDDDPESADVFAASVVSNVNGLLARNGERWDHTQLPRGDYTLQNGLLKLQFGGGVMVYVEAPARFQTASEMRVVLHSGRLSATVPPEGIGFTVETPDAEVVDFGTEFSVDVDDGASEVHVFEGLVRVRSGKSKPRDVSRSVDLQASQAVRITDGTAEPEDISIATDRFIRNFDEPKWNYSRLTRRLSPLAFFRMSIRDHGLASETPEFSGVVLTGDGKRPPHARGVFVGGSLRSGVDSAGRGGRVDSPPALTTGMFSLTVFVYLEAPAHNAMIATNLRNSGGNFRLSLNESGILQAAIRNKNGDVSSVTGGSSLSQKAWRHVVVTADGEQLQFYEDGKPVASEPCAEMANSASEAIWFGTDADATQVWDGRIDEVALFDRALTAEDVVALYRTAQEEIARSK